MWLAILDHLIPTNPKIQMNKEKRREMKVQKQRPRGGKKKRLVDPGSGDLWPMIMLEGPSLFCWT